MGKGKGRKQLRLGTLFSPRDLQAWAVYPNKHGYQLKPCRATDEAVMSDYAILIKKEELPQLTANGYRFKEYQRTTPSDYYAGIE